MGELFGVRLGELFYTFLGDYGGMEVIARSTANVAITCKSSCRGNKKRPTEIISKPFSREDRIRTCDPVVPNHVFYRAELPPDRSFCCYQLRDLR